jgi:hypothetical protein
MKRTLTTILFFCFCLIAGCATYKGAGSQAWYEKRLQEIEDSYAKKEITPAEYIRLKNETDSIRADYEDGRYPQSNVGFSYGIFR